MGAMGQAAVTPERIMQMAWGFAPTLMMEAAVSLRVFDILDDGPKSAEMVASLSGASVRGSRALMNGLAGFGLLTKNDAGQYGLASDAAAFLVSSRPAYLGALTRHLGQDLTPMWQGLGEVVRTGLEDGAALLEDTDDGVELIFGDGEGGALDGGNALTGNRVAEV